MMAITIGKAERTVEWTTAAPLLSSFLQDEQIQQVRKPALLRFKTDSFMQDLVQLLQTDPRQLAGLIARPESFRAPPTGEADDWQAPPPETLKLYQPVHGFFYLIAASLVCHMPGLPDRVVNTTKKEKVSFVLRRIGVDGTEMAWVSDPSKDPPHNKNWVALAPDSFGDFKAVAKNEELLPMLPLNFTDNGRKRRLLLGLIPTSSYETFQATPSLSLVPAADDLDLLSDRAKKSPLLEEVDTKVVDPLDKLVNYQPGPEAPVQEASQFILLDFALFLSKNLPTLWAALTDPTLPAPADDTSALYAMLKSSMADSKLGATWQVALQRAWASRSLFADGGPAVLPYNLQHTTIMGTGPVKDKRPLEAALEAALAHSTLLSSVASPPGAAPGAIPTVPKLDPRPGTRYVLRCVFQRPNCGPLQPDVVSDPTESFEIAAFFDFDAPARPIRITMPIDTSIAGLRKYRKNVGVLISNKLRQQMESITDLKKALDGQVDQPPQFDLGTICSFSIPIITICALIVLMIFLILLNIVFWWLPFIRICFPIKLKAS
jgi:hypothetical protein